MSDQERLENIKKNVEEVTAVLEALFEGRKTDYNSDIDWLMQQAERAIEGEEELDKWTSGRNVAVSTYGEIKSQREENERLQKQLEEMTSIALWVTRRLYNAAGHRNYAYDAIEKALGTEVERV